MFWPRIRLMGHHGTQFRAKADLPVGFPYRFNSRKYHTHTYPDVSSVRYAVVKKKKKKKKKLGFEPRHHPLPVYFLTWWLSLICFILVQMLLHWYLLFEFPASALSLRSADNVGRPFCCCVVFSFLFIFFLLFLSHYLRSAISLPFFIGSLSYLASW